MTPREAIEHVLRKHLAIEGVATTTPEQAEWRIGNQYLSLKEFAVFCNDLLACCQPQMPSREALVELLRVRGIHSDENQPLIERLMAWATGQRREWCKHWDYQQGKYRRTGIHPEPVSCSPDSDWTVCPICTAPRPEVPNA